MNEPLIEKESNIKSGVNMVSDVVKNGMFDRAGVEKYNFIYKVSTEWDTIIERHYTTLSSYFSKVIIPNS